MANESRTGLFLQGTPDLEATQQTVTLGDAPRAADPSGARGADDFAVGPSVRRVSRQPAEPLDVRSLVHPSEHSRLLIALSASAVVFGAAAMALWKKDGWTALAACAAILAFLAGLIWLSLQVYRSRLLGSAVRVSDSTLPELQSVVDEVRIRLNYQRRIDVYVMDKVSGGSAMTSYLGTRLIQIEGGLVADLFGEQHRAELTYLIGRHIGQLKSKHQRLWPILLAISMSDSLKFLRLFLAPYYRATVKSGDQIGAACCGDIRATAATMNRLLVGKELGPQIVVKGVLDQAATVRRRWLPRLAQLFMFEPYATNRYLNLLGFFARVAPDEIRTWRASLDDTTARRLSSVIAGAAKTRMPSKWRIWASTLLAGLVAAGLLAVFGLVMFGGLGHIFTAGSTPGTSKQPAGLSAVHKPGRTASTAPTGSGGQHAQTVQPMAGISSTLSTYFDAINSRDYALAWAQLSAADQALNPYPQFAAGESTTTIADPQLHSISAGASQGSYVALVTFRSYQAPSEAPNHIDSCDNWTLDYTMIHGSGGWLINAVNSRAGLPPYSSCT
jgi:hypothetical protein